MDFGNAIASQIAADNAKRGFADVMHDRLMRQIASFEEGLNKDEEIGAYLASFGKEIVIQIEDVGFQNPYFIVFYGKNMADNSDVTLVQHVTQINVLFVAVKLRDSSRQARRIGFVAAE